MGRGNNDASSSQNSGAFSHNKRYWISNLYLLSNIVNYYTSKNNE
jgi:hypothetical protein